MKFRVPAIASALLIAGAMLAPVAHAASTTVVISQFEFRGPQGGNDELVQIKNISSSAQDISGWQIWGSNQTGSATSSRATVPSSTTLPAGKSYLFTNVQAPGTSGGSYSGSVPGDVEYTTGISDNGGLQLRNAAGTVVDAVGSNLLSGTDYREGAGLNIPTANGNDAFERKNDGTQDTDDNAADFSGPQAAVPENCGSACNGGGSTPQPCATGSDGTVPITSIQTLGDASACEGKTVTVRGIVTGIDNLYGSSYDAIYKADSGIWLQQATRDPSATTSSALFVSGIRRDMINPTGVVGDDITITGRIQTLFGLVELVPPGEGSISSPAAQEVDLANVATINSTGNALPAPVEIDTAQADGQDPATRPYYRSLQGMRVHLAEGIATGGGTTKFNDVYLEPGTTAQQRLFRKNVSTAESQPWLDDPEEIGIAPDGGAGNPLDPRLPWTSTTTVNLDLFDVARDITGPLTYTFDYYEIMPQPNGPQPTVERGPINAAYPPAAPDQPANTLRMASFNVENYFPVGATDDDHTYTTDDYTTKTNEIAAAIHNFLRDPDIIAVQEVAVFADGKNALTGLASKLGDYTPYITVNTDPRGIATGFLIKDGITASNPRLLGQSQTYNDNSQGSCDLAGGPLYERAPFALDVSKGDFHATVISNHFASQSHADACRIAEAEYLHTQVAAMESAGTNVIVAGDLNDFETSTSLAHLTAGNALSDLWYEAPADNAYSYKFDGHLQTLDHVLVSPGLLPSVSDMRYVHFDNDYYARGNGDGTGVSDHDPPLATFDLTPSQGGGGSGTDAPGDVGGSVGNQLELTLGAPASFGTFVAGIAQDYTASTTATATSTGDGAQLTVVDPSTTATGHLVNGTRSLAQPLQVAADDGAFAPLSGTGAPLLLKTYDDVVAAGNITLQFKQSIGQTEGLHSGDYGKTLTFTLSSTTP